MVFADRKTVERLRKTYPVGCRIVLDEMDDPYTKIPVGAQATCKGVDDAGDILCAWDMGSSLKVAYGADRCHKVGTEAEAKVTLDWYGKHQPEEDAVCPRCGAVMPGPKGRHDQCGTIEALEKAGLTKALSMMEWTAVKDPQNGGGLWNG